MSKMIKVFLFTSLFWVALGGNAQQIPMWKLADLQSAIKDAKEPTIINFWATFCKPCVAELPYFQALANQYKDKGIKLIMVSLDLKEAYPKKVLSFAQKLKLTSPVVFLDESNADLFCPVVDSSWSGAIPASLFINNATGYRKFLEEELTKEKLEREIQRMLREEKIN
ncbi:MAG TPA: TlpA disulfide reductase family protein [Flavisolibacter sp.]|nr:TlpA disulfide reductase family protein [Flavisolibacter sp.]